MCAVIGIYSKKLVSIQLFKRLLDESMIRGKHATGISYIEDNTLKSKIIPTYSKLFDLPKILTNIIIGHCRYSTSDLEYNQPIFNQEYSVVHNGVIEQSNPKSWAEKYNMKFKTKNDSEILLNYWIKGKHPLELNGSIASIILSLKDKSLNFFRNEQRPLYFTQNDEYTVIASTKDILKRSGFKSFEKTISCFNYNILNNKITKNKIKDSNEDLQ